MGPDNKTMLGTQIQKIHTSQNPAYMITDLPWLIQGHLSHEHIIMFFQANVNKSSTQRFQVKQVGHLLLGMI